MMYLHWMLLLAGVFLVLERLFPERRQGILRPGFARDLLFLAANGWLLPLLLSWIGIDFLGWAIRGIRPGLGAWEPWLAGTPAGVRFGLALVSLDLVKWAAHWCLHRFPLLWKFHRVHHSVTVMDWLGNWRFHGLEIVYYQAWTAVPLALLLLAGIESHVLFIYYVVETAIGNLNHSNLRLDLGPLHRVFNGPRIHLWHHDRFPPGGRVKNFAIVLSLWDGIFGTATFERTPPRELGVPGTDASVGASRSR